MQITDSDLRKLSEVMENKNLSIPQVVELIEKNSVQSKAVVIDSANEIKLTIDYAKTVEQAIADGQYDWKNNDITAEHFCTSPEMAGKKVQVSAKLFHFDQDITSEGVISEMDKAGYRPANLIELLVLGFLFPELQRQFPIVALGSVWNVARRVPVLIMDDDGRGLNLGWFGDGWGGRCRFLAVHK